MTDSSPKRGEEKTASYKKGNDVPGGGRGADLVMKKKRAKEKRNASGDKQ